MAKIYIYDTTLRDGSQGEKISFSLEDKLRIAKRLDEAGVDYIEGGWPGSNPKDLEFFERAKSIVFKHAKLAAFGSTCRPGLSPEEDGNLQSLLTAETPVVTIFGKSSAFQVIEALGTTLEENLRVIEESVAFLVKHGREVVYDAEHFFDAFKANPDYAKSTLLAAVRGGAAVLALCDTNGGSLPNEIVAIVKEVQAVTTVPVGIHCHNDCELAVANTLMAVEAGVMHVQGTMNGYGERCGNANLCSIIASLALKLGHSVLIEGQVARVTELARYVSATANLSLNDQQPYVGASAFAHKAGVHVSAIMKNPQTYEHVDPESVGNKRRVLVSELSGKSNVLYKAQEFGIDLDKDTAETRQVLEQVKDLENRGYQFEGADASLELLMKKGLGVYQPHFATKSVRITVEKNGHDIFNSDCMIKLELDGQQIHTAAEGNGPVNALDSALRKAVEAVYPAVQNMRLVDYKVRVLEDKAGTGDRVRVWIETSNGEQTWGTVGVSTNIFEASWYALTDGMEYGLMKMEK